jgi:hypothetical protein
MDRVYKMQKYYWTLRRFVMHCQYKRAKIQIDYDLYLNPLVANDKNTFRLLQQGKLFYFTLNNLSKIIVNALTHHSMFFMQPQIIKNPYNNVELKKSDLYNIYFKMQFSGFPVSHIFSRFYYVNFDVYLFKLKYEYELKSYAIKSYADNATPNELVGYAMEMVNMIDTAQIWDFDEDFPDEILVRELRPFIRTYLFYSYSLEYNNTYKKILREKLEPIIRGNPKFGKKKTPSRFIEKVEFYDTIHYPGLVLCQSNSFLTNHKYREREFTLMQNEIERDNNEINMRGNRLNFIRPIRSQPFVWRVSRDPDHGYESDQSTETVDESESDTDTVSDVVLTTSSRYSVEGDGDDDTTVEWSHENGMNTWRYVDNDVDEADDDELEDETDSVS